MIIPLYPTGRIVMCLGGSEVWNWWVMNSLHTELLSELNWLIYAIIFFIITNHLNLWPESCCTSLFFTMLYLPWHLPSRNTDLLEGFPLHILKYPFPNPLSLLPNAHQTSNTDITSSQEFSRNYFSLFAPTPIISCACEYPCTFQVVLWLSIYSPVLSTGLWGLLKGRNCPSWLQWAPILNHMPHVFRTK